MYNSVQYSTVCTQVEQPPVVPFWSRLMDDIVGQRMDFIEWWLRCLPDWEVQMPSPGDVDRADRAVHGSGDRRQMPVNREGSTEKYLGDSSSADFMIALRRLCLAWNFWMESLLCNMCVCVYIVVSVFGLCV